MRFFIHGSIQPTAQAALLKHEHACHTLSELAEEEGETEAGSDPAALLPRLAKKQWNLLTSDTALVRDVYEKKVAFGGIIVQILDELTTDEEQAAAIERLFERYKRLTPKRLYTITRNRVKIRQLPGGHAD